MVTIPDIFADLNVEPPKKNQKKHILQDLTEFDPSNSMEGQPPPKKEVKRVHYIMYISTKGLLTEASTNRSISVA